jgi:predicted nucleic acid-binding protein
MKWLLDTNMATAVEEGAVLVTDDAALLAGDIPGLTVENWTV